MEGEALYTYPPYIIRIGLEGDIVSPRSVYEIYNVETGVVEGSQQFLPSAIQQAMLAATRLRELLEAPEDLEWKVEGEDA